jgi:hypothetical protein
MGTKLFDIYAIDGNCYQINSIVESRYKVGKAYLTGKLLDCQQELVQDSWQWFLTVEIADGSVLCEPANQWRDCIPF